MEGKELQFLGKITAGFTHELKNVLAIIKESSGLMEDLLALSAEGAFPHQERFTRSVSRILEQVERGVELSTRLNRLAHSPDIPVTTVDLNDMAKQLALLAERFARLKGVQLQAAAADPPPTLVTSPVRLQMALFNAMECCWHGMPKGGLITFRVGIEGDQPNVAVVCQGEFGDLQEFQSAVTQSERWAAFQEIVSSLGGRTDWNASEYGFTLTLPQKIQ